MLLRSLDLIIIDPDNDLFYLRFLPQKKSHTGASRGGGGGGGSGAGAGGQKAAAAAGAAGAPRNARQQQQPPSAFRSLVMGSAPGQMGLSDLRARAAELRRTLDELARVLASRPEALSWGDVLEKFGVAGVQAGALAAACGRRAPLAAAYAAHPSSVSERNAAALPVMLSTAPLPEAVAERARRVAEAVGAVARKAAAGGGGGGGGMEIDNDDEGDDDEEKTLERLGAAAASVNALVDSLTAPSALLDARSRERRALAAEAHALAAPPPPPPPRGSASSSSAGGAARPGGAAAEDPKARLVSRALLGRLV